MTQLNCPICGKEFDYTEEWVYKKGPLRFCSWTCLRKDEKPDLRHTHNNGKATLFYTYNGETRSVYEWSKLYNVAYLTLRKRIRAGKPIDDLLKGAKKR